MADSIDVAMPLRVPLWYDFSSTLCYVTLRALERLARVLEEESIALDWQPLDMTQLLGTVPYGRGKEVSERRMDNARRVAEELEVALIAPTVWHDSRVAAAAAITLRDGPHDVTWRERVFSAVFEQGHATPTVDEAIAWARELDIPLEAAAIDSHMEALHANTEHAREQMVSGVPTFMLGEWAFGGIQTDATMAQVLRRFAAKRREGAGA